MPCDAVVVSAGTNASTSNTSLVQKVVPDSIIPWRSSSKEMCNGDVILRGDTLMQGTIIALAAATGRSTGLALWAT